VKIADFPVDDAVAVEEEGPDWIRRCHSAPPPAYSFKILIP
jgi:hypothetical protein